MHTQPDDSLVPSPNQQGSSRYTRILRKLAPILILVMSTILSYKVAYAVSEKYFYDKLFYRKSVKHGYNDTTTNLSKFGYRAKDMLPIYELIKKGEEHNVLGAETQANTFTLAIIGDSYVWGTGIRSEERFATILEQKLNTVRKTNVLSFALPGDSFINHYEKLSLIKTNYHIDLYIYVLVPNDILLFPDHASLDSSKKILETCQQLGPLIYDTAQNNWEEYLNSIYNALQTQSNLCVARSFLENLPSNTIVFEPEAVTTDQSREHQLYEPLIKPFKLRWILPYDNLYMLPMPATNEVIEKIWRVSKMEGHPSAVMNMFFADILYKEILKNPDWHFSEK